MRMYGNPVPAGRVAANVEYVTLVYQYVIDSLIGVCGPAS